MSLPALVGSPASIEWANKIRNEKDERVTDQEYVKEFLDEWDAIITKERTAAFWIENRPWKPRVLLNRYKAAKAAQPIQISKKENEL